MSSEVQKNKPDQTPSGTEESAKTDSIQFKTENIGKWAAKQENPFAEQNRKKQAKRQAQYARRQKATPIVAIVCGVILGILAIIGVVVLVINLQPSIPKLPEDLTLGEAGAQELTDRALAIYREQLGDEAANLPSDPDLANSGELDERVQAAIQAVNDYFQSQQTLTSDEQTKNALILVEMSTFYTNNNNLAVVTAAERANDEIMTDQQKGQFWAMLGNAHNMLGDAGMADYYFGLLSTLASDEMGEEEA